MARFLAAVATVGLLVASAWAAPFREWTPAGDFVPAPGANPGPDSYGNPDVWYYLGKATATRDGNYPQIPSFVQNGAIEGWDTAGNAPWAAMNIGATDIPVEPTWLWPAGEFEVHPPNGGLTVVAWKSPFTGHVAVDGGLADRNSGGGNSINWFVDKQPAAGGYTTLISGGFGVGGSQLIEDGTESLGTNPRSIPVSTGDTLYFVVDSKGEWSYDATALNVRVREVQSPLMSWNPAIDLSALNPQADSHGNPGVWHYLYSDDNIRDGAYEYIPEFHLDLAGGFYGEFPNWTTARPDWTPFIGQNVSGVDQSPYGIFWPADEVQMHPPEGQPGVGGLVVLAWESPIFGTVSVHGGLADRNAGGGNGVAWYLDQLVGGVYTNVAYGAFDNGGLQSLLDGTLSPNMDLTAIDVQRGDTLYLIVDANGSHGWDSTGVYWQIDAMYIVPEPTTLALLAAGSLALARRRRRRI